MGIAQRFLRQARASCQRIVFPEGAEPQMLRAVRRLRDESLCEPILVGDAADVRRAATQAGVRLTGIPVVDPKNSPNRARYAAAYAHRRGLRQAVAQRVVTRPLCFGAAMVAAGDADGMVGGAGATTANLLMAAALVIGYAPGVSTPSTFFIMEVPECLGEREKVLAFADCAMNVDPAPEQLADIAISTAASARALLGIEPIVAMLSFSTRGSASHARVSKVQQAVAIARRRAPALRLDGELQGDAALVERVAKRKCPGSPVAGKANVLIFPDLDSGNIGYKLTQYLGNARAYGPILQGFAAPVSDLSRGALEEDIVVVAAIAAVEAQALKRSAAGAGEEARPSTIEEPEETA